MLTVCNFRGGMSRRRVGLAFSTILSSGVWCATAYAQNLGGVPPVDAAIDGNGVDVLSRQRSAIYSSISLGPGGPGTLTYIYGSSPWTQSDINTLLQGSGTTNGSPYTVIIGTYREDFTLSGTLGSGGTFTSKANVGSTLTYNAGTQQYTFTKGDGTVAIFSVNVPNAPVSYIPKALSLTYPSGEKLTFYYRPSLNPNGIEPAVNAITSSLGYQMKFSYSGYTVGNVVIFNMANETCDPASTSACTLTGTWPTVGWGSLPNNGFTKNGQLAVSFTGTSNSVTENYPSGRSITYTNDSSGRVSSLNDGKGTWSYQDSQLDGGSEIVYFPDQPTQNPGRIRKNHITGMDVGELLGTTGTLYSYDTSGRLTYISRPGPSNGVTTTYTLDGRGNRTQTTIAAAVTNPPPSIVTSASFPATCVNAKTCNKPDYTIDARNNRTDYTYDPAHGGLLTVTLPPDPSGVRPQIRYGYTAISARYRDPTGVLINGSPIYRVTSISTCMSGASCVGTAAEVRTTITYDPDQAGLPVTRTVSAGDGSLSRTTTTSYYPTGDVKTVDGPLPGSDDTTRFYYDVDRRLTGVIGPDPDGSGTALRRAVRNTYNSDDQVLSTEIGTAVDQSDTGMSTFVAQQKTTFTYDAQGRKATESVSSGSTIYSMKQYSYTVAGKLECVATRMNPAAFASLPASACSLGTQGAFGPDRITRTTYNVFRWAVTQTTGYGTTGQTDDATYDYSASGDLISLKDGNNNKTTFSYDPFNRFARTSYPLPSSGAGSSSSTDYDEVGYDAAGNIISRRLRDGTTISFTYDNLGRVSFKDRPGTEPDVSYTYNLLGQLTKATDTTSNYVGYAYDALGRVTAQSSPLGVIGMGYNAAGWRTSLVYPDNFFITYDYLPTGDVSAIKESGTTTLATFGYDNLGRRSSLTRGNGVVTTYTYDPISRLASLVTDPVGTAYDLTFGFSYNPASQIISETRSNAAYSWTGATNTARAYVTNGLNQYSGAGSVSFGYDSRGNLTNSGADTYTYNSENLLVAGPGGASLSYDPLSRLYQSGSTAVAATKDLYDGNSLVGLYAASTGALSRRYVLGPNPDEMIVEYDATGSKRWTIADQRGSILGSTDGTGAVLGVNTYDEYGIPGTGNSSRYQYTGQTFLPELGLYYYKARLYSPTLGRFLQTDPLSYGPGPNLYAYVGNDPTNKIDVTGMEEGDIQVTGTRTCADRGDCANYGDSWRRFFGFANEGPGFVGGRFPTQVTLDSSCKNNAVANDPGVQQKALAALKKSVSGNDAGTAEWGFMASEPYIGKGVWTGELFTEGHPRSISESTINRNSPSAISNVLSGYYPTSTLIHAHPNNKPPSPLGDDDRNLGRPVIAIDKSGTMYCTGN